MQDPSDNPRDDAEDGGPLGWANERQYLTGAHLFLMVAIGLFAAGCLVGFMAAGAFLAFGGSAQ